MPSLVSGVLQGRMGIMFRVGGLKRPAERGGSHLFVSGTDPMAMQSPLLTASHEQKL